MKHSHEKMPLNVCGKFKCLSRTAAFSFYRSDINKKCDKYNGNKVTIPHFLTHFKLILSCPDFF